MIVQALTGDEAAPAGTWPGARTNRKEQIMIRNLKVLGLALVAAFAMSTMVASAASAQQGELTSDGPEFMEGTELATGNSLVYPGLSETKCRGIALYGRKRQFDTAPRPSADPLLKERPYSQSFRPTQMQSRDIPCHSQTDNL